MEEQLISYNTAVLAKEKGFKELCFAAFHKSNDNISYFESGIMDQKNYFKFPTMSNGDKIAVLQKDYIHTILRPTQSLLQKWLREIHNIDCAVIPVRFTGYIELGYYTYAVKNIQPAKNYRFDKWEDALTIALQESLKLINISQ